MTRDLTTIQWARLLDQGAALRIRTADRVAEGRLQSVGLRKVVLDYPPGGHDGFTLGIPRSEVLKVWRERDGHWRRVRASTW